MILRGIGASGGVGWARRSVSGRRRRTAPEGGYAGVEDERARLRAASCQVERETAALAERMRVRAGESEPAILTGQITMLRDPELELQLDRAIQEGETAEAAVDAVFGGYIRLFEGLEDERMRLRAADIRDLQSRLLRALLGRREADLSRLPAGCVLVTRELTPSMAVGLDRERVAAILTETGGSASHAAILTRALGIPAVLGAAGALQAVENGELVLVDGDAGTALPRPAGRSRRSTGPGGRHCSGGRHAWSLPPPAHGGWGWAAAPPVCQCGPSGGGCPGRRGGGGGDRPAAHRVPLSGPAEPPTEEEQLAAYLAGSAALPQGRGGDPDPGCGRGTSGSPGWPCPRSGTPFWAAGGSGPPSHSRSCSGSSCGRCCGRGRRPPGCGCCCPW